MMQRRFALGLLSAFCLLLVARPGSAQAPEKMGDVLRVRQEVTRGFAEDDESTYDPLEEKKEVFGGQKVISKRGAGTAILFNPAGGPRGLVQLGSDTKLAFEKKAISEAIQGTLNLRIEFGRLFALFSKQGAPDEHRITISTPNGLVILGGTALYLEVARDGSTSIFVLEGFVLVEPKDGGDAVPVPANHQTYIAAGQAPTAPMSFETGREGGPDLQTMGEFVLLEPPLIDLDDPRLDLPK
jgi:hypothetical protein